MNRFIILFSCLLSTGCTRQSGPDIEWNIQDSPYPPVGTTFTITGRYRYIDGDRLLVPCEHAKPCIETLVRDERLSRDPASLQGSLLTLEVTRIAKCAPDSSEVACIQSADGTALKIRRWLGVGK